MESPVDVAMQFVRSEVTKKEYRRVIRYFLAWAGLSDQDFVKRAGEQPKWAESIILNFIGSMTKRGVTPAYTALHVAAIKSLLDYNDVTGLNWKKLKKAMPPVVRHGKDRAPTVEEIRRILSHCGLRERAIVLAMASGGFRVGAWPLLQMRDFSVIKERERVQAGRLLIYRGEPEEYVAFLTPEAVQAFEAYFEFRRQSGEGLNPSSPLIRDSWDTSLFGRAEGPHPMSLEGIRAIMLRVLARAGLKEREFKQLHGFRKFFKTRCEQSVKSIYVEMLMGHSLGISNSYMKTPEQELLAEYLKAVPSMTIQEADELKRELSKKDEDIHKLGTILEEIRFRVEYLEQRDRLEGR